MRRLLGVLVIVAICFWGAMAVAPGLLPPRGQAVENDFQAAQQLLETLAGGEDSMIFRAEGLTEDGIFRALEATYPYAFSLHCTRRGERTLTVRVEVGNQEAQKQASLLAAGVVGNLVAPDLPLRDRLRVLHDYVIKNCAYDTDTAARESLSAGSGADAPFTAAGALVDGKAVCAGYARAYMQLCRAAGIDMVYISDTGMNHGWNAVRLYGEIRYIDVTFDDPVPDRGELVSDEYFLKSADEFAQTHTWDRAFYDELIDYMLPQELDKAQRIFDLGLLTVPPTIDTVREPLPEEQRRRLESRTGVAITPEMTGTQACDAVWDALCQGTLARELTKAGIFDEVRARQVGIPENVMKK